ncbi:hypothetical protein Tco_0811072 [Tanacetum coccineum]
MTSTKASIFKASKRPKINIIPPKQLFVDLTQDDIKTPSPKLQLSSPSAPNTPSKTPSTKDTSSSSIDYIPKSSTSSTSLSPNGYLNPSTSPPPIETDIREKDEKSSKNDKTEHGMEKCGKDKVKSKPIKSKSTGSTEKVKVNLRV